MKSKIIIFCFGFFSALTIMCSVYFVIFQKKNNTVYFKLDTDYRVAEYGLLKKGTLIQYDEGMSEGFTRFKLYLNLKGGGLIQDSNKIDVIIPYWLNKVDTIK